MPYLNGMAAPMQDVKFTTVDDMLGYLPPDQYALTVHLRDFILDVLPEARESLSYNVLFYSGRRRICYLWPGAIAWGGKTYEGVDLGLLYGFQLEDDGYMSRGKRRTTTTRRFHLAGEPDYPLLRALLQDSWLLDRSR